MFFLKKLITHGFLFPGNIILLLLFICFILIKKKQKFAAILTTVSVLILYLFSIPAVSDILISKIENSAAGYEQFSSCDVIVLLGGGVVEGVEDLSGVGVPGPDMNGRILSAVRLYRKFNLPIIVTGGAPDGEIAEAVIVKRFLVDLGVPEKKIILETKSLDTRQNAEFSKKIMLQNNYKKAILVTSAYHINRASFMFESVGVKYVKCGVAPEGEIASLSKYDFLPRAVYLRRSEIALKEILGILFYKIIL